MPENKAHRPSAGARVAAVVALLTLVAAAGLVLLGLVRHLLALLAGLACVVICVTAGWYAVSRRRVVRVVAAIVAVAAVAGLIASLVFEDYHGLAVLGLIVVAAVSVAAARYALRVPAERAHVTAMNVTAAARAEHPVLIMNLKSGGGKAEKFRLADECKMRGIEPIVLQPEDDLLQLAEDAVARGADVIGMAGGDGSQALVATVASRRNVPHVCVPAGTRNHFALDLGLDRNDVVGALDAFADAVERRIDLASVNGRIFVNNASLGLYAKVVQSPQYRDAKISTAATILPGLLGPEAKPLDLQFRGPDADYPTAHLILVSNDPYQMDHLVDLGTRQRLDLGVLGIVAARIADAAQASRFVAMEAAGRIRRFPGWLEWSAPQFEVKSGRPVDIGIDGEALRMDPPLVFESLPGALRVRLPPDVVHPSRARKVRLLSGSTIVQLAQVVGGRYA